MADLNQTPSANRVHIAFFGKRNAGKSSVVNAVTGQNISTVSDVKGTTISDIYMFPILNGSLYLKESDTSNFWGYLGYGDVPARLTGLYTSVPGASDVAIDDAANSTDTKNGTTPNSDLENAASEDAVSDTPEIVDDGAISDDTAPSEN